MGTIKIIRASEMKTCLAISNDRKLVILFSVPYFHLVYYNANFVTICLW